MGERLVLAAGGVLWRMAGDRAEVAVVHRPRYDDWSLPKGKAQRREHPLATACREVQEETGIRPVLGPRLSTQRYRSPAGPKVVHYWAMSGNGGRFTPSAEVDGVAWLPVSTARGLLSYRRDVAVLDGLTRAIGVDAVMLLVRHAVAGHRATRPESHRPLGRRGNRQAQAIRRILPGFAPARLLCIPDMRRRGTLAPLGAHLRLPVEMEPALVGRPSAGRPSCRLSRVRELIGVGGTTVVAASGAVIQQLVTALAHEDHVPLPRTYAKKASVWALFFHGGRLATADYYPSLTGPRW